jgi:hypothetical protein
MSKKQLIASVTVDQEEPVIHRNPHGKYYWFVEIFAIDETVKELGAENGIIDVIKTKEKCRFDKLKDILVDRINELLDEMPTFTKAGWKAYRIKH